MEFGYGIVRTYHGDLVCVVRIPDGSSIGKTELLVLDRLDPPSEHEFRVHRIVEQAEGETIAITCDVPLLDFTSDADIEYLIPEV